MSKLKGRALLSAMAVVICSVVILGGMSSVFAQRKVVIGTDAGDIYELLNSFAPQIKKELGIDLEFKTWPLPNQYEVVMLSLAAKTPTYDLVTYFPQYLGDFGPYLTDIGTLGDFEKDFVVEDIVPAFLDNYMIYRDKWVGVTFDGDVHVLTYRKDLFEDPKERAAYKKQYGTALRPPQTYDEFNDIARFFTRPEQNLWGTDAWYKREIQTWFWWYSRLLSRGGELFDSNGKARVNDEIGVWAMENFAESFKYAPPGALSHGYAEVRQEYFAGRTAMQEHWPCLPKVAADPNYAVERVAKNVGIATLPGGWHHMPGGRVFAIPQISPNNKKDAYAVLKFFATPELTKILVADTTTHLDPWRKSHFTDPSIYKEMYAAGCAEEFVTEVLKAAETGIPHLNIKFSYRYQDVIQKRVVQVLAGELKPKEAMDLVAREWDRLTDDIGKDIMLPEIKAWHELLRSRGYLGWMRKPNWDN